MEEGSAANVSALLEALLKRSVLVDVASEEAFRGFLTDMASAADIAAAQGYIRPERVLRFTLEAFQKSPAVSREKKEHALAIAMAILGDVAAAPETWSDGSGDFGGLAQRLAECIGGASPYAGVAQSAQKLQREFSAWAGGTSVSTAVIDEFAAIAESSGLPALGELARECKRRISPADGAAAPQQGISALAAELSALFSEIIGLLENGAAAHTDFSAYVKRIGAGITAGAVEPLPGFTCKIPVPDIEGSKDLLCEFIAESQDHLSNAENSLLTLEKEPGNPEEINRIFRAFHTIKGSASFMNLEDIRILTHETETMMDMVRKGTLALAPHVVDAILTSIDSTRKLITLLGEQIENNGALKSPYHDVGQQVTLVRQIIAGIAPVKAAVKTPKIGEVLLKETVLIESELSEALKKQGDAGNGKKIGEILVESGLATPGQVERAVQAQQESVQQAQIGDQSIKIAVGKLDNLIDMVGELVISGTQVIQNPLVKNSDNNRLVKDVAQLERIIRDIQDIAMSMRLVPIRPVFQKMVRLVHDVSRKSQKPVEIKLAGEETEIDKNIIDLISDPLMHMVRNSVDHGVEKAEVRSQRGKPETGLVQLNAFHKGGNIVIEVKDDGGGLDRDKILAKARERGLVRDGEVPADAKIYGFIFDAGFSTAEKVTDISGRGVGMDVVKRNIEMLRGKVDISTEKEKGTTFAIRLPLTLAIIDGIVMSVGVERYIAPVASIIEFFSPQTSDIVTVAGQGLMIRFQGNLYQLIKLTELFGVGSEFSGIEGCTVCLVDSDYGKACIAVDRVIGQQQVVIKNLGDRLKDVKGVAGGTILGDGKVGLILDVNGIVEKFRQ